MHFRKFTDKDARFCFQVRSSAFIEKFFHEIGAKAVTVYINAYLPEDFVEMSNHMEIFIVEDKDQKIGFTAIKRINHKTAEIPFIYFDLKYLGQGYGKQTMKMLEDWVKENWEEVNKIFLDTIVPKYNGGFYRKIGYKEAGDRCCQFYGLDVKAKRFEKVIK